MEPLRTSQTPGFGLKPILDFLGFSGFFVFFVLFLKNIFPNGGTLADLAPPPEAAAPHGAPWAPWGPMGPHGPPWAPMGPHGALWGPMGPYGGPMGPPWGPMGSYGPILWLDPIPFRAVDTRILGYE